MEIEPSWKGVIKINGNHGRTPLEDGVSPCPMMSSVVREIQPVTFMSG